MTRSRWKSASSKAPPGCLTRAGLGHPETFSEMLHTMKSCRRE